MVSSGLVDAAEYEKEQKWLGAILTPTALKVIEKAKAYEKKIKGETIINLSSDKFKPYVRYGIIPWKDNSRKPCETYYIKPFDMADKNWAINLPKYFNDKFKIDKSNCLYAED